MSTRKSKAAAARKRNNRKKGKVGQTNTSCPAKKALLVVNVRRKSDGKAAAGVQIAVTTQGNKPTPSSGALDYSLKPGTYTVTASVEGSKEYILDSDGSKVVELKADDLESVTFLVREYATLEVKVFYVPVGGSKTYLDNVTVQAIGAKGRLELPTTPPPNSPLPPPAPLARWDDIALDTYEISAKVEGELLERCVPPDAPVGKVIAAGSREKAEVELKPRNLKLVKVDDHFAPSHENLDITYDILRLKDREVMLQIYGYGDVLMYERPLTDTEKTDGDGKIIAWDGKRNQDPKKDAFITPIDGPFQVKLESGTVWKGALPFHVLYESIDLDWGVHTPDGAAPGIGEQEKYAQYRLNVLGYDGGPVNGVIGAVTTNALKRFQRANYQHGTTTLLTVNGTLDGPTLAALQGAPVDRSGTRFEGGAIGVTTDAKLFIEDNFYTDRDQDFITNAQPEFNSADRATYAEPLIERPYLPLEVKVKLLTKGDAGVEAPQAIGEVPIAWEMDDQKPDDAASNTIVINIPPPVKIQTAESLPPGVTDVPYTQKLRARFGTPPYEWRVVTGQLPTGIGMDPATGVISGKPVHEGACNFTVTATDKAGKSDFRTFKFKATKFAITTASMPPGLAGKVYAVEFAAAGGRPPYKSWTVTPALPAGLTLDANTGAVNGTPAAAAAAQDYTFEVSDRGGAKATRTINFAVKASAITTEALPDGSPGKDYNQTLAAEGNAPFSDWRIVAGDIPAGMSFSTSGVLSGKPVGAVQATLTFQCREASRRFIQKELELNIKYDLKIAGDEQLPHGSKDQDYEAQLTGEGGFAPYTWRISAGKLPSKLRLNAASGRLSGVPEEAGSTKITVELTDSTGGAPVTKEFEIVIADGAAITTPPALGETLINTPFEKTLQAAGQAPFTWSLPGNPAGWTIDGTGKLSGTPAAKGKVSIAVRVVDSSAPAATQAEKTVTIDVVERKMPLPPSPDGAPAAAYPEQTLAPAGGTAPYSNFRVDSGALPPGLKVDPDTGKINGTPTHYGTFRAKIEATDSSTPPINAATNPKAKDYVLRALQLGATANITAAPRIDTNGDNVLDTFGGFRKLDPAANVKSWFPDDADSVLAPYSVSGYDKETRDGKEYHCAIVKCWDHKTDHPARRGRAGVYFRHSKIAGDDAKIRAALTFHGLPNKDELEKLHKARKDQLFKESGRWQIWRRTRVSAYCQQGVPSRVPADPNWGWVRERWKEAFLEVENGGSPLQVLNYGTVVPDATYKNAILAMPAAYLPVDPGTGVAVTMADLTYRANGVYGSADLDENNVTNEWPADFESRVGPDVNAWDANPINAILKEIHKEARKTSPEGLIVYDFSLYHQAFRQYDWDGAHWNYQYDYDVSGQGYVWMDGAVTMDVNNSNDVSCYTLHEAGHGRYLHHHITSGGSGDASDNPNHHDKAQVRCTMSYPIDGDPGANWTYSFCGKCLLKLRGVNILALPSEYTY